jgi:hypothetical protein
VLVGTSPGVGRCNVDCTRGVREEELVARSVDVDVRGYGAASGLGGGYCTACEAELPLTRVPKRSAKRHRPERPEETPEK